MVKIDKIIKKFENCNCTRGFELINAKETNQILKQIGGNEIAKDIEGPGKIDWYLK